MINLLADTLAALNYYGCNIDTVQNVVFYNEDNRQLENISWSDYTKLAQTVNYDPQDYEFIGFRGFKPRLFIVGQGWFLARTLRCDNYEGWKYYDHDLEFNGNPISGVVTEDTLAYWISNQSAYYSDYTSDEDFQRNVFPGEYSRSHLEGGTDHVGIVHGINGRIWWYDYDVYNKHSQLLYRPEIAGMVISGDYLDTTIFNNANLSQIIGVEDAGFNENQTGELTVTYIPIGHFTICLDSDGNEVVVPTIDAPYSNSL